MISSPEGGKTWGNGFRPADGDQGFCDGAQVGGPCAHGQRTAGSCTPELQGESWNPRVTTRRSCLLLLKWVSSSQQRGGERTSKREIGPRRTSRQKPIKEFH